MYNLGEIAFEAMLENIKRINNGNPFMKLAVDSLSYEYNRSKYNNCIQHINEENYQIISIYNQIRQRGGLATQYDQQELQRHLQLRSEYEAKRLKHFSFGSKDAGNIVYKLF